MMKILPPAGVSHAAPKNHFGDVMGLLSDLAAVGFARFRATMEAHVRKSDPARARLEAIGRGYVTFARAHPDLFLLMFRGLRLRGEYVDAGGLMSYGVNYPDMYRSAVDYVAKILKGANPSDLPVWNR
jgi:AcrR family transcriptional regulator